MQSGERLVRRPRRHATAFHAVELTVTAAQFTKLCDENLIRQTEALDKMHWYELTDKGRQIAT